MNNRQKIVQEQFLNDEKTVIRRLNSLYTQALRDINKSISEHYASIQAITDQINALDKDDPMVAILESRRRSKVYQKAYQEQLKTQVSTILDKMNTEQFLTVSDYLNECYNDGFIGTMFDLHGQGIPIISPIDQRSLVKAVQLDSKISKGLYTRLGEDVDLLKKKIVAQVSRSMATGTSYAQCAKQLKDYTNIGYNRAIRIARTEGHRVQTTATMDAMTDAKDKGADVVKQWDATLDGRTRESHAMVDGEIRELNEKFSNGLMYPGSGGKASEVVNCRCALLQRARCALDEDELNTLKDRAAFHGLDKADQFDDFKEKYLKSLTNNVNDDTLSLQKFTPAKTLSEASQRMSDALGVQNVSLGRMPVELANQYLEGTERFMQDFPMLKGYYSQVGTKTGASNVMGVNKLTGTYIDNRTKIDLSCELHLKSTKDINAILKSYADDVKRGGSYTNESPLSTAIHELVHGIDKATTFKQYGAFDGNGLGAINASDWHSAKAGVSHKIITQVRQEIFGTQYGKDVADATRYLGSYARTSSSEELAEAISYEYVSESNPYSARILELFKEYVKGVFGQ